MSLFGFGGPPVTLNIRKAKSVAENFFKKKAGLRSVETKIDGNGAQTLANDVTIFDYEVLYLGVCYFESGYFALSVDFDTDLTSPPQDLLLAMNRYNNEGACWKAYFDEDSINFSYEVDEVNDDSFEANLEGALNRLLDDDSKKLMQPMFKYYKRG